MILPFEKNTKLNVYIIMLFLLVLSRFPHNNNNNNYYYYYYKVTNSSEG